MSVRILQAIEIGNYICGDSRDQKCLLELILYNMHMYGSWRFFLTTSTFMIRLAILNIIATYIVHTYLHT